MSEIFFSKSFVVLQSRRHQLKAKISFLREQDAVAQKTRPRGRTAASSLPPHMDRRLDVLAAHHVKEDARLEQDHLQNISDFRIQSENTLRPSQKVLTSSPKTSTNSKTRARKDEIAHVEKCKVDATQRELTLIDLSSSLKSYIIACTQTDMVNIRTSCLVLELILKAGLSVEKNEICLFQVGSALNSTAFYREKFSSPMDKKKILSVDVYNSLMNIFAKKVRRDRYLFFHGI